MPAVTPKCHAAVEGLCSATCCSLPSPLAPHWLVSSPLFSHLLLKPRPFLSCCPLASSTLSIALSSHMTVTLISPPICLNCAAAARSASDLTHTFDFLLTSQLTYCRPPDIIGHPGLSSRDEPLMTIIGGQGKGGQYSEWSSSLSINRKSRVHDDMILCANIESSLRGEMENGFVDFGCPVHGWHLVAHIIPAVVLPFLGICGKASLPLGRGPTSGYHLDDVYRILGDVQD